jgi:tRNA A-37 threonylcarbamoyl transferase component Bud32/tetratricopeptide (TPR) repeat protein
LKLDVEELFHEVADLSIETRARYLNERHVDATVREELEDLLAFDSRTIPMLENEIWRVAAGTFSDREPQHLLCGPWRTGEILGRGGMGSVYLAERVDGEVTQRAAVKVLRAGMDAPQLRQRFLAERQILASLSHPNVARLLDAGHRADGQPYLVMEYVEGKPLDVYAASLSRRQKISLFVKVCAAVGYLHRNLVVHRDLKPANILVTEDGEPKLLDFGIAKILDLAVDSAATNLLILTPDYASPEQMLNRPVSTASDIYSLGAVLYQLLTGQAPRRFGNGSTGEIARVVSDGEIVPPSSVDPSLKGDLEFILLKALRPEPQERYATADQLCEDLENYLRSGPVRARGGDTWYRTRKLLRRHWMAAAAAVTVLASLAAGLQIANRERLVAERRFSQLRQLSTKVIDLDGAIRTLPGSIEARQKLVAASLQYLEGLSRETRGNPDLTEEVADGYWRMARIQGVNAEFNLGDTPGADQNLRKADALIGSVLAARPEDRNALFRAAVIAHDRMLIEDSVGRRASAITLARAAVDRLESFVSRGETGEPVSFVGLQGPRESQSRNRWDSEHSGVALLYSDIAVAFVNTHLYAEGALNARRSLEIARMVQSAPELQGPGLSVLANALRYQGDLEDALITIRQARQVSEQAHYASETARYFSQYGLILREALILGEPGSVSLERPAEAIALYGQALQMSEEAARKNPRDSASRGRVGTTARGLGDLLRDRNPQRSIEVLDLGIQRVGETGDTPKTRRERAALLAKSSYPLRNLGRTDEARKRIDSAFGILQGTGDYPSQKISLGSEAWTAVCARADFEAGTGSVRDAVRAYEQLLDAVTAAGTDALTDLRNTPRLSRMYETMAALYRRAGDRGKAAAMDNRRVELWEHWQSALPQNAFIRRQLEAAHGLAADHPTVRNQS